MAMAGQLARAGDMVPRHLRDNPPAVLAVILAGQELGIAPMAAMRGLHLVEGKVGASYDLMIALLRRHRYRIEWLESTATCASLKLTAPDGTSYTETWDEVKAKRAGLWGRKGPWSQYPDTMLRARCVSMAARAFAGDVLAGVYETEELREIATDRGVSVPREIRDAEVVSEPDLHPLVAEARELGMEEDAMPRLEAWCEANGDAIRSMAAPDKKTLWGVLRDVVIANDGDPQTVIMEWLAPKKASEDEDGNDPAFAA